MPVRPPRRTPIAVFRKFVRTPKGYMLGALLLLLTVALPNQGVLALEVTVVSVLASCLAELLLCRALFVPTSALLTGLFVAMVMDPHDPLAAIAATSALAIGAKHLVRTSRAHIFNPAALALAIAPYLFGLGESWWGAAAGLPVVALLPLLAAGYVVVDRTNKAPSVLAFLGVYFALFTIATVALPGENTHLAQFYRDPFVGAALFFAFFMLTDPPTSPVRLREQLIFGAGVAVLAVTIELSRDMLAYLFLGLLIGNAWWAWRRVAAMQKAPAAPRARLTSAPSPRRSAKGTRPLVPRPAPGSQVGTVGHARPPRRKPPLRIGPANTDHVPSAAAGGPGANRTRRTST
jgi:Na+-translocating ferredoxin:NAD+ oxidoreductase RnfD subunit